MPKSFKKYLVKLIFLINIKFSITKGNYSEVRSVKIDNNAPNVIENITWMGARRIDTFDDSVMSRGYFGLDKGQFFTTFGGAPVFDMLNILTAGKIGPQLIEDTLFLDQQNHFNRERIPERIVHAKGAGAFGYFEVTNPEISKFTKASLFAQVGKKTPIAARFSTVIGSKGSADTVRDPRGFAVKFYTEQGNLDILGLNFPVFFVRDPLRFMNFIHSQKPDPQSNLINYDAFWDFISLVPETFHTVSYLFSDLGTPDGYRHMNGFSINAFRLVNAKDNVKFAKFHFLTDQGVRNLTMDQANLLAGFNPNYATEDLFNAISRKNYPSWTLYIQIMSVKQAENWLYNPFDPTKIWPEKKFPLIEAGRMVLTHNQRNFFAQIEQLAFNPANLVPGIEPSLDKVLQGRLFAYNDAQTYRLGTNFHKIPVNLPRVSLYTPNIRDGAYCFDDNYGGSPNYYPNSFNNGREDKSEPLNRWWIRSMTEVNRFSTLEENYSQVRQYWRSLSEYDKRHLVSNIANHLSNAKQFIQSRVLKILKNINTDYYQRVKRALERLESVRH